MVRVTGEFEVTLRTPIAVSFDFHESGLDALQFDIDKNQVLLRPLEPTPPFMHEGEVIEYPTLVKLRIWITKDVQTLAGNPPDLRLPHKEHETFEPIIIEATRRFVTTVKARIRQWDLDHRHPVYCYSSKYSCRDHALAMEFPLAKGHARIPKDASQITWSPSDFHDELTEDIWKQVAVEIKKPVQLAYYEEAIFDAKTFRRNLRYDTAVLYAAFAAEIILQELSTTLLKRKGGLDGKQVDIILKDKKTPSLIQLVEALHGCELPRFNGQKLEKLFKLRNDLAHRKKTNATSQQATGAIKVSEQLKKLL